MNQADETRAKVRAFILKQFPLATRASLDDDASLVETGIMDSMGVLELVMFIESDFALTLSDDDVVADNFDSIATISSFVEDKLAIGSRV